MNFVDFEIYLYLSTMNRGLESEVADSGTQGCVGCANRIRRTRSLQASSRIPKHTCTNNTSSTSTTPANITTDVLDDLKTIKARPSIFSRLQSSVRQRLKGPNSSDALLHFICRVRHGRGRQDEMPSKTPHTNGDKPTENGINGAKDVEMKDDAPASLKGGKGKKVKEGEDMTVVVPPSKGSKLSAPPPKDTDGDVVMDGHAEMNGEEDGAVKIDPVAKAVAGT